MSKKYKFGLAALLSVVGVWALLLFFRGSNFAVLNPKGSIAEQQRDLIIISTLIMLLIVVPVLVMTFVIAYRYREGNTKAKYSPNLDGNRVAETIWWTFPLLIVVVLSAIIWKSSHTLDPFQPIAASKKPITIQVVALDWKWLFIYPEYNVATLNYVQFPVDTPINFQLTSDAPMNSFWIPQLGGQIYAMAGMDTQLHLIANEAGSYNGQSANLSGKGFAGMNFVATASSDDEFNLWLEAVRLAPRNLTMAEYEKLAKPTLNEEPKYYATKEKDLYARVIAKYLSPDGSVDFSHGYGGGSHAR
ncbi:MAG: ubiquinol oxidase subunit II [Candidatus Saccharimonadales bacterium]